MGRIGVENFVGLIKGAAADERFLAEGKKRERGNGASEGYRVYIGQPAPYGTIENR
jgi:hypothetical protein